MGTWGIGPFENDGACDFVVDFTDAPDRAIFRMSKMRMLTKLLSRDLSEDFDFEEEALAAAEVVAAMLGRPCVEFPEELAESLPAGVRVPDSIRDAALHVCDRLLSGDSNLYECWSESEDKETWVISVKDLRERLSPA